MFHARESEVQFFLSHINSIYLKTASLTPENNMIIIDNFKKYKL